MATLTDRYVAAAARSVPESSRPDLRAELQASITDAVEARVATGESPAAAERSILTELGDPERLAAQYADRPLQLIGPRFYLTWRRLLVTLLWIVPAVVAGAVVLGGVIAGDTIGEIIGSVVPAVIMVVTGVAFWTTLVFALLERFVREPLAEETPWNPDALPDIKPTQSGLGDLVASLSMLALLAGAVVWDHVRGFVEVDGQSVPILDPDLWPWTVAALFVVLLLEAAVAVAVYRRGCWTVGLAVANVVLSLAFAVPVLWLLGAGDLVNPVFLDDVVAPVSPEAANWLPTTVAVGVVVVSAIEIVDTAVKAVKARRDAGLAWV
jgi:hypothetical protein